MRQAGAGLVVMVVVATGCGSHHVSMNDAVLRFVCGDRCKNVQIELSNVRQVQGYAVADLATKPPSKAPAKHVVLHRVNGDWQFVDAWSDLNGVACAEVARQMRVPETVFNRLGVC